MRRIDDIHRLAQTGFSLVELMVALAIGMIVSIAVFSTLLTSQQQTKTTTSVNSRNQAGAFAAHQLDFMLRNAGTGLLDYSDTVAGIDVPSYGCLVHAAKNGQTLLPSGSFMAPFNTLSGQIRLAPFLIKNGIAGVSDTLLMMHTSGSLSSLPSQLLSAPTSASLNINNVLNYRGQDRLLVVGDALQPCLISQAQTGFTASAGVTAVPLAGEYYQASIDGVSLSTVDQYVVSLGQSPKFILLGVSETDGNLYQYDLLEPVSDTVTNANPNLFIENVVSMQAVYGVDPNGDGDLTDLAWVPPTGSYDYAAISADPQMITRIKAVKIALVLRADEREANAVSEDSVTVFADTSVPLTLALDDTHYRYKAFEVTIPIRNSLL